VSRRIGSLPAVEPADGNEAGLWNSSGVLWTGKVLACGLLSVEGAESGDGERGDGERGDCSD